MNIVFFTKLNFSGTAMLARVIVSLPCFAALAKPVWAIVSIAATVPGMIVWPYAMNREPCTKALKVTKIPSLVDPGRRHKNVSATLTAGNRNAFVMGTIGIGFIGRNPFPHASPAAKVVSEPLGVAFLASEGIPALRALNVGAAVLVCVGAGMVFAIAFARARATAIKHLFTIHRTRFTQEFRVTLSAFQADKLANFWRSPASSAWQTKAAVVLFVPMEVLHRCGLQLAAFVALLQRGIHEVVSRCSCIARSCGQVTGQTVQSIDQMPLAHKVNYTMIRLVGALS